MKINLKLKRAFTLIEVLVVVSIVGILSSVILGFVNGARESGRITAMIQFDTNIKHTIGDQLVGEWLFNLNDNPTLDTSGFGNSGVSNDIAIYQPTGGYNKKGAYYFNCSNGACGAIISAPASASLNFGGQSAITETAWINPKSFGNGWRSIIGKDSLSSGHLDLDNNNLRFMLALNGGSNKAFFYGPISLNKWSHVAVSYNGINVSFYVNGVLVSKQPASGKMNFSNTSTGIGSKPNGSYAFDGILDDVRIYTSSLTALGIQQLYAEGLKTHQDLALIK